MKRQYLKLEDLSAYNIASELADLVWDASSSWDWFAKQTLGAQFVKSTDSIAANIAEGFGRYHRKDKIKFYYNARGSVFESAHWCKKAYKREFLSKEQNYQILNRLRKLPKEINRLIKLTRNLEI